jgi:hypothetical protein
VTATQDWFRLFMVPDVGHCGMDQSPFFDALVEWVEHGVAPNTILHTVSPTRTRPLCPHPELAMWTGQGSSDDAENFECRGCLDSLPCSRANEYVPEDDCDVNRAQNERVFGEPYVASGF